MSLARKVFLAITALGALLGLVIGLINLVAPDAASVSFNGEEIDGLAGVPVSILISVIPAAIFGLIAAGIVKLFTRRPVSN